MVILHGKALHTRALPEFGTALGYPLRRAPYSGPWALPTS